MRRFRFRLEKLLTIRRYREREWEIKLAGATAAVLATRRAIDESHQGIAQSFGYGLRPLDGPTLAAEERYRSGLQARIETLHAALARQETELEKVRAGYLAASRNRKVLDKLRERQGEAYRKQQGREEGTRLDEIAAQGARGR